MPSCAAVRVLEDDPESSTPAPARCLTRDGTIETDAAVMDGATGHARRGRAAVHGISAARSAPRTRRVLDAGGERAARRDPGAWAFARERGLSIGPAPSLLVPRQRARLDAWLAARAAPTPDHGGTVGAVARDRAGRFAAATSTGGMLGKRAGRVGDSPIVGAGTWADERVALSATGDGEAILRVALAHAIARADEPVLAEAIADALRHLHARTRGSAGVIGVDARGVAFAQLSATMPVAWITADERGDGLGRQIS